MKKVNETLQNEYNFSQDYRLLTGSTTILNKIASHQFLLMV